MTCVTRGSASANLSAKWESWLGITVGLAVVGVTTHCNQTNRTSFILFEAGGSAEVEAHAHGFHLGFHGWPRV